jgi:DNA end-binding protein Ku
VKTKKVALGKVAFAGRESILAVMPAGGPEGRGMMAFALRFANEVRNAADYFREIKPATINDDSLELAEALIAKRSAKFDISKFQDGYENAVKELVDAKLKHLPLPLEETPAPRPSNVINLMDALRKSVGEAAPAAKAGKKPPVSEKEPPKKGIGIVKTPAKSAGKAAPKRKSA